MVLVVDRPGISPHHPAAARARLGSGRARHGASGVPGWSEQPTDMRVPSGPLAPLQPPSVLFLSDMPMCMHARAWRLFSFPPPISFSAGAWASYAFEAVLCITAGGEYQGPRPGPVRQVRSKVKLLEHRSQRNLSWIDLWGSCAHIDVGTF